MGGSSCVNEARDMGASGTTWTDGMGGEDVEHMSRASAVASRKRKRTVE